MNKETLRMQMLSGIITESEYKAKLEENSDIPNDIEWEIEEIGDWIDPPYGRSLYMIGYSPSTGEEFEAYADGVSVGGGDWEWDNIQDITKRESKGPLNENFVGMGMVGNIFDREKTDYELAFEHFAKGTSLNEEMEDEEDEDYSDYFFDIDTPEEDLDETKKPGTKKERSAMAKKARAGKDIGEKGKNFEKIAKSAAKKYGSEEAGKKVAGAVMYGKLNK